MGRALLGVAVAFVGLAACAKLLGDDFRVGDGSGGGGSAGGTATTSTTSAGGGAGTGGGAAGTGGVHAGGAPPCIEGFTGAVAGCSTDPSGQALVLSAGDVATEALSIELYYAFGAPPPPPAGTPFGFDFYGEDYATCGVCARMADLCDGTSCARQFVILSGHLEVTAHGAAGGQFTGVLTDAVFAEAVIDPQTFHSTFVELGATHCVPSFTFDATVVVP
ncbi:MAG: hypothetical protein HY908_21640 [Myxococcales bacterium]|nr:hypothetical protein [Myxococcales bacterium]